MTREALFAVAAAAFVLTTPAAASVTATGAPAVGEALLRDPAAMGTPSFFAVPGQAAGVGTALGKFPTHGSSFAVLSTGMAVDADDPNQNDPDLGADGGLDDRSTNFGATYRGTFDATVVGIPFTAPPAANCLTMDFQFLTEEFPEYVDSQFNDTFLAELDGNDWKGNFAFDAKGAPVTVTSVGVGGFSRADAEGTTFDGATPLLRASRRITPGPHTLYLSIADHGDGAVDSAAFVDNVRAGFIAEPERNCVPGARVALYSLEVVPVTGERTAGTEHAVSARLIDDDGAPVAGVAVRLVREGANPGASTAATGADGVATLAYTGMNEGSDELSIVYDADGEGTAEATASASVRWTPAPPPPPAPPAPAPAPAAGTAPALTTAPPAISLLRCHGRAVVLTDVSPAGRRVRVSGVAQTRFAGSAVAIAAGERTVAATVVRPDGTFETTAPRPTGRAARSARFTATVAGSTTRALKVTRMLLLRRQRDAGAGVVVAGRLTTRSPGGRKLIVRREDGCTPDQIEPVATVKTRRDGRFRVTLARPSARNAVAVYRLTTASGGRTFTLPILVRAAG